jgi:signal transduction histidine kinase
MATKNSWKRSAEWVTALKDKPLRGARFRLTALYVLHTFVILSIFVTILGYVRIHYIREDLAGQLNPASENQVIEALWSDLQRTTTLLLVLVLAAIAILSYFAVELTLRPIRIFLEGHRRFIADASHELRTPLAVMRTEIEVALLDPDSISKQETVEILQSNAEEIERMSKILTNLLNLASFNDVTGEPPMAPVDLKEIVEGVSDRIAKTVIAKRIELSIFHVESVSVLGNAVALEEVISNLLKNAVNYTNAGGKVFVSLREMNEKYAELIIRDTGVGIAPEELPHVFEPFYRSERSFHMDKTGSGLGLPLVKEMIKRHKGSIHVESAPGKGTSITVHLPLAPGAHRESNEEDIA